jgi:large subunit ribosomal protein L15
MKYNELITPRAKTAGRVGRGISAGRGKTAGRGTKGQGARKSSTKYGFAGGQTPIHMQLPKLRGFKSKRDIIHTVYTGQIDAIKGLIIDNAVLAEAGLAPNAHVAVKLISKGELKSKKTIKVQAASASAIAAVDSAGGSVEIITRQPRLKTSTKKSQK